MDSDNKVLIITGPAGSGKSTLAAFAVEKLSWRCISEDDYWVRNGWSGMRTEAQEATVQEQVLVDAQKALTEGEGVALEFILYKDPPNPLTAYQTRLEEGSIAYKIVALKPSLDEIMRRIRERGREHDLANLDDVKKNAENQLRCLEADYLAPYIIDSTQLSVEGVFAETTRRLFARA